MESSVNSNQKKKKKTQNTNTKGGTTETASKKVKEWKNLLPHFCAALNKEEGEKSYFDFPINSMAEVKSILEELPHALQRQFDVNLVEGFSDTSAVSYKVEPDNITFQIVSPGTRRYLIMKTKQRSGATTVPLSHRTLVEYLSKITPDKIHWEYQFFKRVPDAGKIEAGTELPTEGKCEYKQFYKLSFDARKLFEAAHKFIPPLLNYGKPMSLVLGVQDETKTVVGIPIDKVHQEKLDDRIISYCMGHIFPPLPKDAVQVSWKEVTTRFENETKWYQLPPETEEKDLNRMFQTTFGHFKIYTTVTTRKYFVETEYELPPPFCQISKPMECHEVSRFVIEIDFNLNGLLHTHIDSLQYWYLAPNETLKSLNCFGWWIDLRSKHTDDAVISRFHGNRYFRILQNCTLQQFQECQYFRNVTIDHSGMSFTAPSAMQDLLLIYGLDRNTSANIFEEYLKSLRDKFPQKRIIVCFFVLNTPSYREFPDMQLALKKEGIMWDLVSAVSHASHTALLPIQTIDTHSCAEVITAGSLLSNDNLEVLARKYLKGLKLDRVEDYTLLVISGVIIERNVARIISKQIDSALKNKETSIIIIEKRFHGSGATSLLHWLGYSYHSKGIRALCLTNKQNADWAKFEESLSQYNTPVIILDDELNYQPAPRSRKMKIPIVVLSVRSSPHSKSIELDPFLNDTEIQAMISSFKFYFPNSADALDFLWKVVQEKNQMYDRHIFTIVLTAHRQVYQSVKSFVEEEIRQLDPKDKTVANVLAFLAVYTTNMDPSLPWTKAGGLQHRALYIIQNDTILFWHIWLAREYLIQTWNLKEKSQVISDLFRETLKMLQSTTTLRVEYLRDIFFSHSHEKWSRLYEDLKESPTAFQTLLNEGLNWFSSFEAAEKSTFEAHKQLHLSRLARLEKNPAKAVSLGKAALQQARKLGIPDLPFLNNLAEAHSAAGSYELADELFMELFEKDPKLRTATQALNNAKQSQNIQLIAEWEQKLQTYNGVKEVSPFFYKHERPTFAMNPALLDSLA